MLDLPLAAESGDVLSQPTRARLFRLLDELARPAPTAELARRLGLHPNGVRAHLGRMEDAGLVARARVRHARGRPRDVWTVAPSARPAGRPPQAYADLGRWLARAMRAQGGSVGHVEEVGREIGHELAPDETAGVRAALPAVLAALGFEPRVEAERDDGLAVSLGNCPYRDAVRENPDAVCALHRGITRGVLEALDPSAHLAGFVPRHPDRAGCRIEVAGLAKLEVTT
jgi:predicted ArsR family transcriptional regulator